MTWTWGSEGGVAWLVTQSEIGPSVRQTLPPISPKHMTSKHAGVYLNFLSSLIKVFNTRFRLVSIVFSPDLDLFWQDLTWPMDMRLDLNLLLLTWDLFWLTWNLTFPKVLKTARVTSLHWSCTVLLVCCVCFGLQDVSDNRSTTSSWTCKNVI